MTPENNIFFRIARKKNLKNSEKFQQNFGGQKFFVESQISNLLGFYQYIMADMLIITRADYENIPVSFF